MTKAKLDAQSMPASPPVDQIDLATYLVKDIARSVLATTNDDPKDRDARTQAAIDIVQSLAPADVLETQLIVQMVMGHIVATEAIRRASRPGEHPNTLSLHLRDASRFMNLYREQVRTLTHYRGTPRERRQEAERASRVALRAELNELQPHIRALSDK